MSMMLIAAVAFVIVACLIFDAVARNLNRRGSDCWWWFEHQHIAQGMACIVIYASGVVISFFGSWPEAIIGSVWFGHVVFVEAKHLLG